MSLVAAVGVVASGRGSQVAYLCGYVSLVVRVLSGGEYLKILLMDTQSYPAFFTLFKPLIEFWDILPGPLEWSARTQPPFVRGVSSLIVAQKLLIADSNEVDWSCWAD